MLWILFAMILVLFLAAAVAAYVGLVRRGREIPVLPWAGEAMRRGVAALPTLHNQHPHLQP